MNVYKKYLQRSVMKNFFSSFPYLETHRAIFTSFILYSHFRKYTRCYTCVAEIVAHFLLQHVRQGTVVRQFGAYDIAG